MIRNIPNHYTQLTMVRELEGLGFQDSYDFLYVPLDKGTNGSVGYPAALARVSAAACWGQMRGSVTGCGAAVPLQGLEANLRHYRNAAVTSTGNQGKCNGPIVIANLARSLG
ncbi:unnamed protein product, partial [Prorocentrum cordatum]